MYNTNILAHPAYRYAQKALYDPCVPQYVKKQCTEFLRIADGENPDYILNLEKLSKMDAIINLLNLPEWFFENCTAFHYLFCVAVICTVKRSKPEQRRYKTAILETGRKNGSTFISTLISILMRLMESSVEDGEKVAFIAPDDNAFRIISQTRMEMLHRSPFNLTYNKPTKRESLEGADIFVVDMASAFDNENAAVKRIEEQRQRNPNSLLIMVSSKCDSENYFENKVKYAKKVLNKEVEDSSVFALIYEPDLPENWETDPTVMSQSNPLIKEFGMDDLKYMRRRAVEDPATTRNFLIRHLNIPIEIVDNKIKPKKNNLLNFWDNSNQQPKEDKTTDRKYLAFNFFE